MRLPWQAKIAAKIVLSRLPIGYRTWSRLSMFKHGYMERPEYAIEIFEKHFRNAQVSRPGGFAVLELGPGDSVASAVIAQAHGAARTYLVDTGPFARMDMAPYRALAQLLRARGREPVDIEPLRSGREVLAACGGVYLTDGLASLRKIPDGSVDFIWSNAVLEHVDRGLFAPTLRELRRVLRDSGTSSHRVDLQDHLGESLNSLRLSRKRWESAVCKGSGFYTNRLRRVEILEAFEDAGFDVEVIESEQWDRLPVPRHKLAAEFQRFTDAELCVRSIDIVASRCQPY